MKSLSEEAEMKESGSLSNFFIFCLAAEIFELKVI